MGEDSRPPKYRTKQRPPQGVLYYGSPRVEDLVRTSPPGRVCSKCGRKLSIYNHGKECAQCVTA